MWGGRPDAADRGIFGRNPRTSLQSVNSVDRREKGMEVWCLAGVARGISKLPRCGNSRRKKSWRGRKACVQRKREPQLVLWQLVFRCRNRPGLPPDDID